MDISSSDSGKKPINEADLSAALDKINLIESMLAEEDDELPSEITFHLPLKDVIALFPQQYLKQVTVPADGHVTITMDDLYSQLSKGKATMSIAKLAFFVPSHLLQKEAFADTVTMVNLPLAAIVKAVGVDKLGKHMATKVRRYKIDDIADPFAKTFGRKAAEGAKPVEPTAPQPQPEAPKQPVTPPQAAEATKAPEVPQMEEAPVVETSIEAAPVEEAVQPAAAVARKRPAPAPIKLVPEIDFEELPGNVNINTASMQELCTLDGMTEALANRIIEYRGAKGPFENVFDLVNVPRLSKATFKRMTGMAYNAAKINRRYKLAHWLNLPVEKAAQLPLLTEAIAKRPGFIGCILCDKDAIALAQSKADGYGDNWCAVACKIMSQVSESVNLLNLGGVDAVSVGIKGNTVTIVSSANLVMSVMHEGNKLTSGQLGFIQHIRNELTWLLSHRAYAGL